MAYPSYRPGQAPHRFTARDGLVLFGVGVATVLTAVPLAIAEAFRRRPADSRSPS